MYKELKSGLQSYDRGTPISTMRKYYHLALVIISVVSVVTLLFYRHEYIRLRHVLEVLNFFGKPGQTTSPSDCLSFNITQHGNKQIEFTQPLPTWQRISDTQFIYSAFWEKLDSGKQVRSIYIEIGKNDPKFDCQVWFEDRNDPVPGKFNFSPLDSKDSITRDLKEPKVGNIHAYYLYCKPQEVTGVPYGTTFYKTDDLVPSKPFIPIHHTKEVTMLENSTAICIAPISEPGLQKSMIVEFLSYHQLVGINDFIVYDRGFPNRIASVLQSSAVQEGFGLSLSTLPWNFPFPSEEAELTVRLAMEKDCILRSTGKVRNIAVLAWNEYIVPRFHHSLAVMLDNFDSGRKTTARFEIPTIVFCTEYPDEQRSNASLPLVLRKTRYRKASNIESPFHVYRPLLMSAGKTLALTTQRVSQGIAAVHRYTQCSKDDAQKPRVAEETHSYEPAMLRFAEDFKRSRLLRAWKLHKLL